LGKTKEILNFPEIAEDFLAIAHTIVWCSAATQDTQNRLRSRVLHPIWEIHPAGPVGWVATTTGSPKVKHLAHNPHMSLCYMNTTDVFKPLYVDCRGEWVDDLDEKTRICNLFSTTPPPLGYDLLSGLGSPDNPAYALLKMTPWRIELGDWWGEARVWRA
jgi:hypothetical protein